MQLRKYLVDIFLLFHQYAAIIYFDIIVFQLFIAYNAVFSSFSFFFQKSLFKCARKLKFLFYAFKIDYN